MVFSKTWMQTGCKRDAKLKSLQPDSKSHISSGWAHWVSFLGRMLMVDLIPHWFNMCGKVLNKGALLKMKTLIVADGVCSLAQNTQAGPALGTISPFTLGI
jgi:hypothetical protein